MKTTILLILLLSLLISSLGFVLMNPVFSEVSGSSPLLIGGDLVIPSFQTLNYTNQDVSVNGSIIFEDRGTLFLKNSTLNLIKERSNITLRDSSLMAFDSKIKGSYFNITFEGKSSAKVLGTSFDFGGRWIQTSGGLVRIKGGLSVSGLSEAVFNNILFEGFLRTYNSSTLDVTDMLTPPDLETYGHSSVSFVRSKVEKISAYNASTVSISSSTIRPVVRQPVRTFDSSRLVVIDSLTNWQMEAHGSSSAVIVSSVLERLATYDSSFTSLNKATITEGLLAYGSSRVFVFDSIIDKVVELNAYLSAYDSSMVIMSDTTLKGTLSLHGSSNITVNNSIIGSLNIRGSSDALLSSSKVSAVHAIDVSSVSMISNSSVEYLSAYDSSLVSLFESEATLVSVTHSSKLSIVDSRIKELIASYKSINGSFVDVREGTVADWDSKTRTLISVDSGGYAPSISLKNTETEFWSLYFSASNNLTIANSTFHSLSISATTAYIMGSIVSSYEFLDGTKTYFYWYLDVQAPSNATVNLYDSNMNLVESKIANNNGRATFALLEKIAYTVDVSSPDFSGQQKVEMTSNKQIALMPSPPLWQQYWYIIILAVVAAVAVSIVLFRARRGS